MNEVFNITDLFFQSAKKTPSKTAIVFKEQKISFDELKLQVMETAHYFISKGINKGDRVFILVPMSIDLYRIVLALFKIGAIAVFVDEWADLKRIRQCCKAAECKATISVFKARIISFFLPEFKKIPVKLGIKYNRKKPQHALPFTTASDTALITFTTGSTAIPKAAKRTHEFLYNQFNALIKIIQPTENDVDMPVLPIVLLINLGTSTTSVIANYKSKKPDKFRPEKIFKQIKLHSVNRITASPFFIKKLSEYAIKNHAVNHTIKKIFTGGAPVFPAEAKLFCKAFNNTEIKIIYGSTEAEPISVIDAKDLQNENINIQSKGLIVGKTDENIEVKIIKIKDENIVVNAEAELLQMQMPFNEIGEIIVKGKHVLTDYLNNENALKRNKIFIDKICWHRTGDCGCFDENYNLYLFGRCNSIIESDGKYLSPFMYENYFQHIDGIKKATIIKKNKKIIAAIELSDATKKEAIKNYIWNNNIEIKEIVFIKKIPLDPRHNSKIDYEKLRTKI